MRKFVRLSILFWLAVIRYLELKTSPAAMLRRLQAVAILMTAVLLFLLPLALPVRLALYGLLSLLVVGLVLQSRERREFKSLIVDTDAQTVSINYWLSGSEPAPAPGQGLERNPQESAAIAKPLSCRVEYFSQRLIMLAYREEPEDDAQWPYLRRLRRLPVFPAMLSHDDYRRLLAVVRLVQTR